jgi:hypothetical protein
MSFEDAVPYLKTFAKDIYFDEVSSAFGVIKQF